MRIEHLVHRPPALASTYLRGDFSVCVHCSRLLICVAYLTAHCCLHNPVAYLTHLIRILSTPCPTASTLRRWKVRQAN